MSQRMDNIDDTIGCFGQKWNKLKRDKTIKYKCRTPRYVRYICYEQHFLLLVASSKVFMGNITLCACIAVFHFTEEQYGI